jgi:hypothetical protein
MLFVIYISYLVILFFIGRGSVILLNFSLKNKVSLDSAKIFNVSIFYFYPIIGLLSLGNFAFLLNFIIPLEQTLLWILTPLIALNLMVKINMQLNRSSALNIFLVPLPFFAVASQLGFHYDAGLYHLKYQSYLRATKIIFGHVNLDFSYGFSSLADYIGAMHWISGSLVLLSFIQIPFFILFFNILNIYVFQNSSKKIKNASAYLILYLVLDNFGYKGGVNGTPNIQNIPKYDTISAILVCICVLFYLEAYSKASLSINEKRFLLFFTFAAIQIRPANIALLILTIGVLLKISKHERIISTFKENLLIITLSLMWILKNIIVSSCIFFPVRFLCYDGFLWSDKKLASTTSEKILYYFKNTEFELLYNQRIIINFSIFIILIIGVELLRQRSLIIFQNIVLWFYFYLITNVFLYLFITPTLRFFNGVILSSILILTYFFKTSSKAKPINLFLIPMFIFSLLFIPRVSDYRNLTAYDFNRLEISYPKISYINFDNSKYVIPENGEQCWLNIDCIPYEDSINGKKYKYNYLIFVE